MSDKNINTNMIDELLSEAFLELDLNKPENEIIMNVISKEVMCSDTYASHEIKTGLFRSMNGRLILQSLLLLTVLGAVGLYFMRKFNSENPTAIELSISSPQVKENIPKENFNDGVPQSSDKNEPDNNTRKELMPLKQTEDTKSAPDTFSMRPIEKASFQIPLVDEEKKAVSDSQYVFPKLTEKEIKENEKQKKKMIEQLMKFNKKAYAFIPMGTFDYKGETISLNSFYMQTMEVTNLEYRTFIYDLLINNRKEEFLKAKPDQQQWMKEFNRPYFQPMVDNYFSHPAYDQYPVVAISRESAQMYCNWLTIETNKILKEKGKPLMPDLRIPQDAEWTYAAEAERKGAIYPWDGEYPQNAKGCFLANFCLKKYKRFRDTTVACAGIKYKNAYTTGGSTLGEGTMTVWVDSYNPNKFGLYCMAGNVAEMVQVYETKTQKFIKYGTKGGGWNSDEEHIKIHGEDEYEGKTDPSVFIGFRPVVTYLGTKTRVPF